MKRRRMWTQEEVDFLEDEWGVMAIDSIARKLNRSFSSVHNKAQRLGLGDPLTHIDGITISQLSQVLNKHYGILENWINKYNFPARRKRVTLKKRVLIVHYSDFWKWADENKQMLDFARLERLSLGPEPDWVEVKRKADEIRLLHRPKPHNTAWSKYDDNHLKWMLERGRYTYPEISDELKRSEGAIKRRISDLKLNMKPVSLNNHNRYSVEEVKKIKKLVNKDFCFTEIAKRLDNNRSASGVRGKLERLGYKFKNGVPYKDEVI